MLTLNFSDENQSTCFKFIGADSNSVTTQLISNNTSLIVPMVGDCADTCSFYSGPSDAVIMAFGESSEACGSIAYVGGGESCGSIASSSVSSGSSFSGGCVSFSC